MTLSHETKAMLRKRARTRRRLAWLTVVLCGMVTLSWLATRSAIELETIRLHLREAGYPATLAQLNLEFQDLPAPENAAPLLLAARRHLVLPDKSVPIAGDPTASLPRGTVWTDAMREAAGKFVSDNAETRRHLVQAATRSSCRFPLDLTQGANLLLPHLVPMNLFIKVLVVEAELAAEEGDGRRTGEVLELALKIASFLEDEPIVVSQRARLAGYKLIAQSMERVLNRVTLPADTLESIQFLALDGSNSPGMHHALIGSYVQGLKLFTLNDQEMWDLNVRIPGSGLPTDWTYEFYRVLGFRAGDLKFFAEKMDRMLESNKLEDAARIQAIRARDQRIRNEFSRSLPISRSFSMFLLPGITDSLEKDHRTRTRLRLFALSCAIERFRSENEDALPDSLEALIPDFLNEIPKDPWTNGPLQYRLLPKGQGYLIYSVGDLKPDDGGLIRLESPVPDPAMVHATWIVER